MMTNVPPRNLDAERALIGAVILENDRFDAVAENILADDFYNETYRVTWQAIEALAAARKPIDAVTLSAALQPYYNTIGSPAAVVAECTEAVPSPAYAVEHYAPLVRDQAILRRLAEYGAELNREICEGPESWSPDYAEERVANAEYELEQIASRRRRPSEKNWREVLREELWKLEHHQGQGIPTGFDTIDRCYGGFAAGELAFLAARTSRGKTQLAMNFAINAARGFELDGEPQVFPTAFFTLEMTVARIVLRTLFPAGVDLFRARQCGYRPGEKERVEEAAEAVVKLPIELRYRSSMRPRELRLECRRLVREMGLKFAIVDYGGLMRANREERQRWLEMREVVLGLKEIAGELNIPILVLWQLNREVGDAEEPSLANLRDTGASEEHATDVLMAWQPGSDDTHPDVWQDLKLKIAKQRNGPRDVTIDMEFRPSTGQFRCK